MATDDYDALVQRSPQGSVFALSWWLDAVAADAWEPHVVEAGGEPAAAWPSAVHGSRWGRLLASPPLTPFLGPLLPPRVGRSRSREIKLLEGLVKAAGGAAHIEARCSPGFDYWTPLSWHGFTQTTRYTWRLDELRDTEAVFRAMRENVRRHVRNARKRGVTIETAGLSDFLGVHAATVGRKGLGEVAAVSRQALARVEAAASAREARTILVARGEDGHVHAGGYFVHDWRYVYYLMGGSDPEHRSSGASSLLLWSAIGQAAERGLGFDFEGSMLRPVEEFFRAFAGVPAPYSVVRRTTSAGLRAERAVKRHLRGLTAR